MIWLTLLFALSPGETLVYEAKFAFLSIGSMVLSIDESTTYDDMQCYLLRSELNSNPRLNWLFTLNDTILVYSTVDDIIPLYYEEYIHESNHSSFAKITFDHDSLLAWYDDTTVISILPRTRDILSFWYFLRTIPMDVNDTLRLTIHASMENHVIECPVVKKEIIETPLGQFNTLLVSPQTEGKGIFGSGGGMDIWYSDDTNRYPVQIKARMKTGCLLFKLKEVRY
jgi:hypothetical protein